MKCSNRLKVKYRISRTPCSRSISNLRKPSLATIVNSLRLRVTQKVWLESNSIGKHGKWSRISRAYHSSWCSKSRERSSYSKTMSQPRVQNSVMVRLIATMILSTKPMRKVTSHHNYSHRSPANTYPPSSPTTISKSQLIQGQVSCQCPFLRSLTTTGQSSTHWQPRPSTSSFWS